LRWQSESESENSHYQLYRNGLHLASIEGQGTTSLPNTYSFMDENVSPGIKYEYILSNIDYSGSESFLDTLECTKRSPPIELKPFTLGLPYPNPFNPVCDVNLSVFKASEIKMELRDLSGRKIMNIFDAYMPEGEHSININLDKYPSGKYFVYCSCADQLEILEIVMVK
jgi:Secretion system C-terminal sorting domain